jgi:hypothetical protein
LGAFGEKLRKQREQRGLALDAISNSTKISPRMLRALEEEHFDQLPGGVFNKGFVRAYARQVGLDEEEAITDYLTALRESQIQQQSILPDFRNSAGKPGNSEAATFRAPDIRKNDAPGNGGNAGSHQPARKDLGKKPSLPVVDRHSLEENLRILPVTRIEEKPGLPPRRSLEKYPAGNPELPTDESSFRVPWGTLAAALLLVTLVLAVWNFRRHAEAKTASPAQLSSPSTTRSSTTGSSATAGAAPTPPAAMAATNSLTMGKASSSSGTLSAGNKSAEMLSSGTAVAENPSPRPMPTLPTATPSSKTIPSTSTATNSPASTSVPKASARSNPPPAKAVAVKPPPTFTLMIRAEKTTWVSIVADAKPVAEETLIAPAHTSIRATHEIAVRTGNAAGVSFLLNGKEIPVQGQEGEVKTYIFNGTGVRTE